MLIRHNDDDNNSDDDDNDYKKKNIYTYTYKPTLHNAHTYIHLYLQISLDFLL